jgi:NAD(P)-dependent dehydrogenase (short-subunit alcohol dehydrogenase family)
MYKDLEGKIAVVTGSGKRTGIGYAIAEKFASCGAQVVIADLGITNQPGVAVKFGGREEMESIAAGLAEKYKVKTLAVDLDVTSNESVNKAVGKLKEKFERVDALINNAGAAFGSPCPVHLYNEEAWLKTIDVNLHGSFRMSKALVPLMLGKPSAIVNMASKAGKTPGLANGAYSVAKAGVIMLTKAMALELGNQGIRANAICPGIIMTDLQVYRFEMEAKFMNQTFADREKDWANTIPQKRIGAPMDVADLAVYLASRESSYITGQAINVDGGLLMAG